MRAILGLEGDGGAGGRAEAQPMAARVEEGERAREQFRGEGEAAPLDRKLPARPRQQAVRRQGRDVRALLPLELDRVAGPVGCIERPRKSGMKPTA